MAVSVERQQPKEIKSRSQKLPIEHLLGETAVVSEDLIAIIAGSDRNILDYARYMGSTHSTRLELNKNRLYQSAAPERVAAMIGVAQHIEQIPTLHPLSATRINPETAWEGNQSGEKPDLFFGMGGGSTSIIRGTTLDALNLFLTSLKLQEEGIIDKVRAILANRITYTNLPYSPDFLPPGTKLSDIQEILQKEGPEGIERNTQIQEKINRRLLAQRDIYRIVMERILTHMHSDMSKWDIFLQTDMDKVVDQDALGRYNQTTAVHGKILEGITGVDEYHYAQENGIIDALVNDPQKGGVKLGWHIRDLDEVNGGYIMDEQPFHARWILGQALRTDTNGSNKVSLFYSYAAPKLYPDAHGNLRKASPYICYDTEDMITLHPDEDIVDKFKAATEAGGGFNFEYTARYYSGIVQVFEELTKLPLNKVVTDGEEIEIDTRSPRFKGEKIAMKMQAMRNWLLEGKKDEVRKLWGAFEKDSPRVSDGLPMKLQTSTHSKTLGTPYAEALGIQQPDLYYRIKAQEYGEEVFGKLNELYGGEKPKMNYTRDMIVIAQLANEKITTTLDKIVGNSGYFSPNALSSAAIEPTVRRVYKTIASIGENTGIEVFNPSNTLYNDGDFQPDELLLENARASGLHINPQVAELIAKTDNEDLAERSTKLEQFLAIVSYPNTPRVREKTKERGFDVSSLDDFELKMLQVMGEEFFEERLKGSSPRKQWRELYSA